MPVYVVRMPSGQEIRTWDEHESPYRLIGGILKDLGGLIELILLQVGQSQHDIRFRLFRIQRDSTPQMLRRFRKSLEAVVQNAEMEMPLEKCRLELHIETVGVNGFLSVLRLLVDVAEIISDFQFSRSRL